MEIGVFVKKYRVYLILLATFMIAPGLAQAGYSERNFNGGYVGGNLGGVSHFAFQNNFDGFIGGDLNPNGFVISNTDVTVGLLTGFDWNFCQRILGIIFDWNWTNVGEKMKLGIPNPFIQVNPIHRSIETHMDWFITLRGRAGLMIDNVLIYITGGVALAQFDTTQFNDSFSPNRFHTKYSKYGWAGGGGIEWIFGCHWSLDVDLLYLNFEEERHQMIISMPFNDLMRFGESHVAWVGRIGLNYRFGMRI